MTIQGPHRVRTQGMIALLLLMGISAVSAQHRRTPLVADTAVLARVGPHTITAREFLDSYETGPSFVKRAEDPKACHLRYMINEKLIALDGYTQRVDTTGTLTQLLKEIEDDVIVTAWYRHTIVPRVSVDPRVIEQGVEQSAIQMTYLSLSTRIEPPMREVERLLKGGWAFDSVYARCKDDPEFLTEELSTNYFELSRRQPRVAEKLLHMAPGARSEPIRSEDSWQIVFLQHAQKELIQTSTRTDAMRRKVREYHMTRVLDSLTSAMLRRVLEECPPTISGDGMRTLFTLLASRPGEGQTFIRRGDESRGHGQEGLPLPEDPGSVVLLTSGCDRITVREFLAWYAYRDAGIDFSRPDTSTVARVRGLLFTMVRDRRLIGIARKSGFADDPAVRSETREWRDKLTYWKQRALVLGPLLAADLEPDGFSPNDEHRASADLQGTAGVRDQTGEPADARKWEGQFARQMATYVNSLRSRFTVRIDEELLRQVHVSDEQLPRKIDVAVFKKGGTLRRQAFPTIDQEWQLLQ